MVFWIIALGDFKFERIEEKQTFSGQVTKHPKQDRVDDHQT
jgi:hypothetical protein